MSWNSGTMFNCSLGDREYTFCFSDVHVWHWDGGCVCSDLVKFFRWVDSRLGCLLLMQRAKRASTRSLLISAKCKLHVNLRASSSHSTSLHIQTPSKQHHHHGPDHRTIHPGLLREVRGFPEGPWRGFHPEEGGSCLHPGDDHHRGGRQLDHGHQDHRQEHRAEIQVGKTRLSLTRIRHLTFQDRGRV